MRRLVFAPFVCWLVAPLGVLAQSGVPVVDPSFLDAHRAMAGDRIRLCVNADSMLAAFDREAGLMIAGALLLEAEIIELRTPFSAPRYDYRLHVEEPELFVQMTNRCDALLGYRLAVSGAPDWITVSAPYFHSRSVIVTLAPAPPGLPPPGSGMAPVGARIGAPGDAALRTFLNTTQRPQRLGYFDNVTLLTRLADGTLSAALVWEPALVAAAPELLAGRQVRIEAPPFDAGTVAFGLAFTTGNAFWRTAIDTAIASLGASGAFEQLASQHGLPSGEP